MDDKQVEQRKATLLRPQTLAGARARVTTTSAKATSFSWGRSNLLMPQAEPDEVWRAMSLDDQTLSRLSVNELIRLMCDLSPEISRAVWDILRMCNPGWTMRAYKPNTREESPTGKDGLNQLLRVVKGRHGSVNIPINRLIMAGFIRGSYLGEVVLDQRGRNMIDFATPDPDIVVFKEKHDVDLGDIWVLGQMKNGVWQDLSGYKTIKYIPIDPLPGDPYGRPPVRPAFFSALFLLNMLHDLRRVILQQGYPRLDIVIDSEKLMGMIPENLEDEGTTVEEWVHATINEIATVYNGLAPDDAWIHMDVTKVNRPVGAVDSSSLGAIAPLVELLERMMTRALKSVPVVFISRQTSSETQSNREWELYAAGVKALQHPIEDLLSGMFGLALQARGIQADVEFKFSELRASERLRDAQVEAMLIANAERKYWNGWISHEEAALEVTEHEPDRPEPRTRPQQTSTPPIVTLPEEGDSRLSEMEKTRRIVEEALGVTNGHEHNNGRIPYEW